MLLRSLWFRLVGALVAVIAVTLIVVLVANTLIIRREYSRFLTASAQSISDIWPETAPTVIFPADVEFRPSLPAGERIIESPGVVQWTRPQVVERQVDLGQILSAASSAGVQFLDSVQQTAGIAIGVAGLFAVLLGTWLFRQITRPLNDLRLASQKLADGDMAVRIPVGKPDEVGRVAAAFNRMASQLEQQEGLRQQMVADVAHELRTPLSIMQGNIEAMIDDLISPSKVELGELHDEVLRLSHLVEDLRLLSLADAGELSLVHDTVDAGELVETVVHRMTPIADSKGVKLSGVVGSSPTIIAGDRGKLQQALLNLIDNGVRYTPLGGTVCVEAQRRNGAVHLAVTDQGPGIPPEDMPFVFERFWRGNKARNRAEGGSGLGLSIVKQIATLHDGQVSVSSPPSGGTQFELILPVEQTK